MRFLVKSFLNLISLPVFSRIYGRLTKIKGPRFLIKGILDFFVNHYGIDMEEYEGDISDYNSLSQLFVRKLDPGKRPLKRSENFFVSPCDGMILGIEYVQSDLAVQVKETSYELSELINSKEDFSPGWHVMTIYLSPSNYHRFHFPLSGSVIGYSHLKGRLYPVNSLGLKRIRDLFLKNERIVVKLMHKKSEVYIVSVGATFVGSIKMNFISTYSRDGKWKNPAIIAKQLDEMGRFELGSTIVILIPQNLVKGSTLKDSGPVRTGDKLFQLK